MTEIPGRRRRNEINSLPRGNSARRKGKRSKEPSLVTSQACNTHGFSRAGQFFTGAIIQKRLKVILLRGQACSIRGGTIDRREIHLACRSVAKKMPPTAGTRRFQSRLLLPFSKRPRLAEETRVAIRPWYRFDSTAAFTPPATTTGKCIEDKMARVYPFASSRLCKVCEFSALPSRWLRDGRGVCTIIPAKG